MKTALGLAAVVWFLAIGASVPVLAFAVLGYLLVVEGRIASGSGFRAAFPMLDGAPRAGLALAVGWLCVLPPRLLFAAAEDARVVAPDGRAAGVLLGLTAVTAIAAVAHLGFATARGLGLGALLWPFGHARWWRSGRPVPTRVPWSELKPLFWLGVRGFAGALAWLAVPALVWIAARATEAPRPGLAILGGLLVVPVLAWLPFLQAKFAVEQRWRALFAWRDVRRAFRRAPVAFLFALVLTYALTLPLYLLKVVLPPRDAAWLVTVVFVATVLPVRLVVGWAWGRALRRTADATAWLVWPSRLALVAVLCAYAALLFLAPLVDTHGKAALLSHHAFLLPSPF